MRNADLTTIINNRRSSSYLSRALKTHWTICGQYERDDAESRNPRLRSLVRQSRAKRCGLKLPI